MSSIQKGKKRRNVGDVAIASTQQVIGEPNVLIERIDLLFKVIMRFDSYINSTNTKASMIFAWNGVLIGALFLKYQDILGLYAWHQKTQALAGALIGVIGFFSCISNVVAFRVIFPFLKGGLTGEQQSSSLLFFGSVATKDSRQYARSWASLTSQEVMDELADQAIVLAQGLKTKMERLRLCIVAVFLELSLVIALFVIKVIVG